jgi:hypothetical protein
MRSLRNLFILLLLIASFASATVLQTYDSRPSWEAATTGRIDIDFESLSLPGGYAVYGTSAGLTTGGVTFVGVLDWNSFYLVALNPPSGVPEDMGSGKVLVAADYRATSYLNIILPAAATSFGIDLKTAYPAGIGFRIRLEGVEIGSAITTSTGPTFFGITSDTPFSQIAIRLDGATANNTVGVFDNFAYGAAGTSGGGGTGSDPGPTEETPEAATMLMLGSGLLMMRWVKRRQPTVTTTA